MLELSTQSANHKAALTALDAGTLWEVYHWPKESWALLVDGSKISLSADEAREILRIADPAWNREFGGIRLPVKAGQISGQSEMNGIHSLEQLVHKFAHDWREACKVKPFLIFGMPRSMTAWLSCFLTCGPVFCQHELSGKLDSAQEIADSVKKQPFPFSGLADPGALMIWRELTELLPDATIIYVRREPRVSRESLAAVGGVDAANLLPRYAQIISEAHRLCQHSEPKILEFADLTLAPWLRILWGWITDSPLPEEHLRKMITLRVTQKDEIIQEAACRPQTKGAHRW